MMGRRALGKTGVPVDELGLGTCFMPNQGQQGVNDCVARAVDRGIDYFDAVPVDSMLVAHQYNPIYRNAARFLLPSTDAKGVGVAGGAMFMKGWLAVPMAAWRDQPPSWMDEDFHRAYFAYLDLQASSGIPLPELTLRWLLAEQRIHCIVVGFSEWREIESNIEAIERGPLPLDLQSAIDALGIVHPLLYQGGTTI